MSAGYLSGRFRVLNEHSSTVLSRFVFVVSMPALIFISLSRVAVEEFFNWPFLAALGGGMSATFCISLAVARIAFPGSQTELGLHSLTAMYSSAGYIGLPFVLIAFGETALVPGIIGAVLPGAIFLPLAIIFAETDQSRKKGKFAWAPFLSVARTPVFTATVIGLLTSFFGVIVPKPMATFCDLLGGAFTPCALFSAGLFMVGCSVKGDTREIAWLVFAKLALQPVIVWWLAYRVFELEGILPAIATLQAALPTGVPVFILAQHYNTFVARSNAAVVISTALSVVTLSGLLILLGQ
jgi:predicted permease